MTTPILHASSTPSALAHPTPWAGARPRVPHHAALKPGPRRPRRCPGVTAYRVFMTLVFVCVTLADVWAGRSLSPGASLVGPISVVVWAVTLIGGLGQGPFAAMWGALRR